MLEHDVRLREGAGIAGEAPPVQIPTPITYAISRVFRATARKHTGRGGRRRMYKQTMMNQTGFVVSTVLSTPHARHRKNTTTRLQVGASLGWRNPLIEPPKTFLPIRRPSRPEPANRKANDNSRTTGYTHTHTPDSPVEPSPVREVSGRDERLDRNLHGPRDVILIRLPSRRLQLAVVAETGQDERLPDLDAQRSGVFAQTADQRAFAWVAAHESVLADIVVLDLIHSWS